MKKKRRKVKVKQGKLLLYFVMMVVIGSLTAAMPVFAKEKTSSQVTEQASKYKSGYEDASKFGGPSSVGAELQEADEVSEPRFRFPGTDRVYKPWFDFKAHIKRELGLSFGLDFSI